MMVWDILGEITQVIFQWFSLTLAFPSSKPYYIDYYIPPNNDSTNGITRHERNIQTRIDKHLFFFGLVLSVTQCN